MNNVDDLFPNLSKFVCSKEKTLTQYGADGAPQNDDFLESQNELLASL